MPIDQTYIGQELTIFAHALNWKQYYTSFLRPYLGKQVVEVGAGIGATTLAICDGTQDKWVCLEPDPRLRNQIDRLISDKKLPACCVTKDGFVSDLEAGDSFETFVYIDVLEHIEDDRAELESAATRLIPGGRLIVLSPAFNFLYSSFDKSIGHYRRYDKKMYRALTPQCCTLEKMIYLDSVGMTTSLINRLVLSQSMPTVDQIIFWDRRLIPITKWIDRLIYYSFGRSLLGIWKKNGNEKN
ncbi:MAG: class I SAM-dependent methyltransferase [Chloroflexi bacterium]|jgi:SAM-dependent methyltransferase|nr:MAG: class I SAM-dependent methyltransferase [Chloroflexota bacterium]